MLTGWRWLGGVGFVAVLVTYALTFSDRPVILDRVDVVADADAARQAVLLREYAPSRIFDDGTHPGSPAGITQSMKLKHGLYAVAGHALWRTGRMLGADEPLDVFLPNAIISAANVVLFVLLLAACGVPLPVAAPITLVYAAAASPWMIGAIPESWPLTATITLGVLLLLRVREGRYRAAAGPLIGLGMLNDPLLVLLLGVAAAEEVRRSQWGRHTLRRLAVACLSAAALFLGGLSLLSLADPAYRPDRYLGTLLSYSDRYARMLAARGETGPWTRHALANGLATLVVSSVVTDHGRPDQLVGTLQDTMRSGPGLAGLLGYLALLAGTGAAIALRRRGAMPWRADAWPLMAALAGYVALTWVLHQRTFWTDGLLYGPATVPVMLLMFALALHAIPTRFAYALWLPAATMLSCNAHFIFRLREALSVMT